METPYCHSKILYKVEKRQLGARPIEWLKLNFASCVYIRRVRWTCLFYNSFITWLLWTKRTVWLLILKYSVSLKIVCACSMFYPYEGYRSVTPLDAARVNRTIFHNHSVHWYYITLIKGTSRYYIKHDINVRHGKQNPRRGRWLS